MQNKFSNERETLKGRLGSSESSLAVAIRVLEESVKFARDMASTYSLADDTLKKRLLKAIFKDIIVKNGNIEKAVLNAPLDFIVKNAGKTKTSPVVFDGEAFGDPTGNRTRI